MTLDNSLHETIAGGNDHAFAFMADHVSDYAIFLLDMNGIILTWNNAAAKMKGYSSAEIIGQHLAMLYTDADRQRSHPQHNLAMATQHGTYQEETWRKKKDGSLFWAMVEIIAIRSPDGILSGFCKLTRDITVRKALQEEVRLEKERVQVTLQAIGDGVISTDASGSIESLNPKAEQLTGWSAAEAIGHPFSEIFRIADEATLRPQEHDLTSLLKQGDITAGKSPAVLLSRDSTHYAIEDTVAPIRGADGAMTGAVIVFRDVTKSRKYLNTVTHQATHDALTGLVNRIEFEHRLERSLHRSQQARTPGAMLYMDLDQFKVVNDICGHDAGDALLRQLSALYSDQIRDRDTLARLGGDEFALIADHCSVEEAHAIANKILQSTRAFKFVYEERAFEVGVSIGLTTFNEKTGSVHELMRRADNACYIAKQNGRNQIHFQHANDQNGLPHEREVDWVAVLTDAMAQNKLQLHYQPIASAQGNENAFRCEVLLRLINPDDSVVLPSVFLPAAERYNIMPAIDRWVVDRVAQWLYDHRQYALQMEFCAINLSGKTLAHTHFLDDVSEVIDRYKIAPGHLCFEISEAVVVADIRQSLIMINGLRDMGCKVCLDGFGIGMGSFTFLKQLPTDFIKIDGSFICALGNSIVEEKMVVLANEIAQVLGKQTIAEWVENEATAALLSQIGINYLQGHWIGYPRRLDKRSLDLP